MRDLVKKGKLQYDAPAMQVLEVNTEGLVCQSVDLTGYDNAIEI